MTALKRFLSLFISSILILFTLSCAKGAPPPVVKPLVISPAALPAAVINVPYSATLTAVGGVPPFTWALAYPQRCRHDQRNAYRAWEHDVQGAGYRRPDSNSCGGHSVEDNHCQQSDRHLHYLADCGISGHAI